MGKRSYYRKATNLQIEERVTACELLLSRGARKTQIHETICKKYAVHWRTCDAYIARARKSLLKRFKKSREEHRADSFDFYESVVMSASSKPHEKIMARKRIDELLGLDAPQQHEISGPNGEPLHNGSTNVVIVWPHEGGNGKPKDFIETSEDRLLAGPAPGAG